MTPTPTRADFWVLIKVGHNKLNTIFTAKHRLPFSIRRPKESSDLAVKLDKPGWPEFWSLGSWSLLDHTREIQKLSGQRTLCWPFADLFQGFYQLVIYRLILPKLWSTHGQTAVAVCRSVIPGSEFAAFCNRLKQLTYARNTRMLLLASAKYQYHHRYCSFSFSLTAWVFAWINLV